MNSNNLKLTGINSIDEEHRALFGILIGLRNENVTQNELESDYDKLIQYADEHFLNEEKIFSESGYPKLEEHKLMHETFRVKVKDLGNTILEGKKRMDDVTDQMVNEAKMHMGESPLAKASPRLRMVAFLVQWLLQHVNGHDQDYVSYLKSCKREI